VRVLQREHRIAFRKSRLFRRSRPHLLQAFFLYVTLSWLASPPCIRSTLDLCVQARVNALPRFLTYMSARAPPDKMRNARRRASNAAMREIRLEQRARLTALADAVDLEQVGRNYAAAAAIEDSAWRSKP
jgi:hypothetical protein